MQEPPLTEAEGWRGKTKVLPPASLPAPFQPQVRMFWDSQKQQGSPEPHQQPTVCGSSPRQTQPPASPRHRDRLPGSPAEVDGSKAYFLQQTGCGSPVPTQMPSSHMGHRTEWVFTDHPSPSLYPRSEFFTAAPFPQVCLLKHDSGWILISPWLGCVKQISQAGVFKMPLCPMLGSLPASPPFPSSPEWGIPGYSHSDSQTTALNSS